MWPSSKSCDFPSSEISSGVKQLDEYITRMWNYICTHSKTFSLPAEYGKDDCQLFISKTKQELNQHLLVEKPLFVVTAKKAFEKEEGKIREELRESNFLPKRSKKHIDLVHTYW
jgi:hypothetical protein